MGTIKEILMERDGMTENEAANLIAEATEDLNERLDNGEYVDDAEFCKDWFGLEPDYITELL